MRCRYILGRWSDVFPCDWLMGTIRSLEATHRNAWWRWKHAPYRPLEIAAVCLEEITLA